MVGPRTNPDRAFMPMATVLAHAVPDLTDDFACRQTLYNAGFKGDEIHISLRRAQRGARRLRALIADQLAKEAAA